MGDIKLFNNTGLFTEKNICFINSSLQLLYALPEVRGYFAEKKYRTDPDQAFPICDQISAIFRSSGATTSAGSLRVEVGKVGDLSRFSNGEQQDARYHI